MGLLATARAFDELSEVYDETRTPPDAATIAAVVQELHRNGIASLLEVGVGTGRIARPLLDAGLAVLGVDAARRMLAKARAKGVRDLVQGEAHHLPFLDRAFDGVAFVHVLHLLELPRSALQEAGRVSRVGVFALLTPSEPPARAVPDEANPIRLLVRDLAAHGCRLRDTPRAPGQREAEFLAAHPPDAAIVLADREVTEPVTRRLDLVARRASRHFREVPPALLDEAVARVRARVGETSRTFRHREVLARWDRAGLIDAPAGDLR